MLWTRWTRIKVFVGKVFAQYYKVITYIYSENGSKVEDIFLHFLNVYYTSQSELKKSVQMLHLNAKFQAQYEWTLYLP